MENISWVLSLPDEILNGIFYHLNQATVMNTMLISKKFYQIGLQKLYRRIYVLGDFWPSISLSPQADTSFHREFTIINKWKQFELFLASKHISLVKYILFRDTDVECEQEMFSQWPWITVEFEIPCDGQEASIKALMKDNTHNIFLNDWVSLEEDNHTVKILNIRLTESSANVLDLVPHMKALESVAITIGSLERFDSLDLSSKQLLKIKTLNIGIEEVNGIERQSNSIKEFGFSIINDERWVFQEFEWVYKVIKDDKKQDTEIELIKSVLKYETGYPNLKHVVLNRKHYVISQTTDEHNVEPLN